MQTDTPHPGDFDFCDRCGRPFNDPDWDGNTWRQHQRLFMYCEDCGDDAENEAQDELDNFTPRDETAV